MLLKISDQCTIYLQISKYTFLMVKFINHSIQGGATLIFEALVYNLLGDKPNVSFADTGHWSEKAIKEAKIIANGCLWIMITCSSCSCENRNRWKRKEFCPTIRYMEQWPPFGISSLLRQWDSWWSWVWFHPKILGSNTSHGCLIQLLDTSNGLVQVGPLVLSWTEKCWYIWLLHHHNESETSPH